MAYSENFPAQRPIFSLDASNAGRLDPRMTFTRASTANVWDGSKHLSSDNLLLQSSTFNATWTGGAIAERNSGQTDPSGGTDGFEIVEAATNDFHRLSQTGTGLGGSNYAFTVYAKQNSGTRYLMLSLLSNINEYVAAVFDLAGGTPTTLNGSSASSWVKSATQTASGNGYYKCTLKLTDAIANATATIHLLDTTSPSLDGYSRYGYTGDGTSSIDIAFTSLTTTGATDYNATTTQIHREYAPTLVSKANNVGRFDHTTDGQSAGTSLGILIEGQSSNLIASSEDLTTTWITSRSSVLANAAIAPSGELTADALIDDGTAANNHNIRQEFTISSTGDHTASLYAKPVGRDYLTVFFSNYGGKFSDEYAIINLTNGSVGTTSGTISASAEEVGNGWYRIQATASANSTGTARLTLLTAASSSSYTHDGDSYSGVLIWGVQFEAGAFASSYHSGGTTRAAESLSMTDSSLFDNGSGALAAEYDMFAANETSYVLQTARSSGATNNDGVTVYNEGLFVNGAGSNTVVGNTTSNVFHKVAASWEAGSQKISRDGGAVAEDTTTVVPQSGTDKLFIGVRQDGGEPLNGHIKRVAIFNQPLSSTNLQALTS